MYRLRVERGRSLAYTIPEFPMVMSLSEKDSKFFLDALRNPPEPNEALKEAARRHKELIKDEDLD